MTPTEQLEHEHKVILLVLDGAEREAEHIESTGTVDQEKVESILDFLRTFADKCHHAKEENLLFKVMEERGMPAQTGPIAVMLHEHDLGRDKIRAIADALPRAAEGDAEARVSVHDNLLAYIHLLREHIAKEDNVLYPMANRMLTDEDQQRLAQEFDRVESEEMGEGTHEKYHELAHKLAA